MYAFESVKFLQDFSSAFRNNQMFNSSNVSHRKETFFKSPCLYKEVLKLMEKNPRARVNRIIKLDSSLLSSKFLSSCWGVLQVIPDPVGGMAQPKEANWSGSHTGTVASLCSFWAHWIICHTRVVGHMTMDLLLQLSLIVACYMCSALPSQI